MRNPRTKEEHGVLWGPWRSCNSFQVSLNNQISFWHTRLMFCGLWFKIIIIHVFDSLQVKRRKKSTSSFFSVYFLKKMTNYVHLYSSIWNPVNLIYFINIDFMAMNNMLRALLFFIRQVKTFLCSMDVVEVCGRNYKFTTRS